MAYHTDQHIDEAKAKLAQRAAWRKAPATRFANCAEAQQQERRAA